MENSSKKSFKIGTRGSLLAVTQSKLTKDLIENKTGTRLELVKILTQGDQQTDKPLWQMDGKDFFTKELDENLLAKKVDLVIHSYKDLGSERPPGIKLAAITERKYPQDILLIKKSTIASLGAINKLIVGTSSPRRITNIEKYLSDLLPSFTGKVKTKTLRGNVNTRIQKLKEDQYHGIVLALAGLERLTGRESSAKILKELLQDLDYMVLPTKIFPPAASQGALAIETHQDNTEIQKTLRSVHDETTAEVMQRERKAFQSYGGGCHLAVGVHVKKIHGFYIHLHKGVVDEQPIDQVNLEGFDYQNLKGKSVYYMYKDFDFLMTKSLLENPTTEGNIFVTSSHCLHNLKKFDGLWSAGNYTMKKMVQQGHWVKGSAEGFGQQEILNLKESKALQMMNNSQRWYVLSHDKASSSLGPLIYSYRHKQNDEYDEAQVDLLFEADIIYWSSQYQFDMYCEKFPELQSRLHACGLGKTFEALKKKGVSPIPCVDMNHLKSITKD